MGVLNKIQGGKINNAKARSCPDTWTKPHQGQTVYVRDKRSSLDPEELQEWVVARVGRIYFYITPAGDYRGTFEEKIFVNNWLQVEQFRSSRDSQIYPSKEAFVEMMKRNSLGGKIEHLFSGYGGFKWDKITTEDMETVLNILTQGKKNNG